MATKDPNTERLPFKIHPRVFAALGADLVTNDVVAVIELVKNSYDALSKTVTIRFGEDDIDGRYLEVADDGAGMTYRTLEEAWCVVATPNRKNNPVSEVGGRTRRVSGEKGLGRLSAGRLGERIEIITKAQRDDYWRLTLDWSALSKKTDLAQCYAECTKLRSTPPFASTGTRIRILGLYADWDEEEISELKDNLARLVSPFTKIDDFEIRFSEDGKESDIEPIRIEAPEFLGHPPYAIRGQFTSDGHINAKYEFRPVGKGSRPRHAVIAMSWKELGEASDIPERIKKQKPRCGPFHFEIRAWDIGVNDTEEIATRFDIAKGRVRRAIRANKGISVYRDEILVLPKSESTRDWLGLDLRRVSRIGNRLSTSQIVGYVAITAAKNPSIEDTSDREGLVRNDEVTVFQEALKAVVAKLEHERDLDRKRPQDEVKLTELLDGVTAKDLVSEVAILTEEGTVPNEVLVRVRDFNQKLESTRDAIKQRFFYYSRLATVGSIAQMLVHEIRNRTTAIGRFFRTARNSDCVKQAEFSKQLEAGNSAVDSLEHLANTFAPLASRGFQRGRRDSVLEESLSRCLQMAEQEITKAGIEIGDVPKSTTKIAVDPGELDTIILNLLLNAVYWTSRGERARRVEFALKKLSDGKKVRLTINDSGTGVPDDDVEKIFLPGVTRKPDGIGMGLTVASELVSEYGGKLALIKPGRLGGASFAFELPLKVNQ